jgi:hypothetical protein
MRLKYEGPIDEVDVPGVGPVKRGATFECAPAVAGRHPSKRWLDLQLVEIPAAITALDHNLRVQLLDELVKEDCGEGLLAQWPSFVHAAPVATKTKPAGGES